VLQQDNVATVVIAKFNIKASYFNRKECSDPVPTTISTNPEKTIPLAINGLYDSPWTLPGINFYIVVKRVTAYNQGALLVQGRGV
jgi:hypothetical protein